MTRDLKAVTWVRAENAGRRMITLAFQILLTGAFLLAATESSAVAAADDVEVVPFRFQPPEQTFFLRGGLNLQDGRIRELPHELTERTFIYCRSAVTVRAEPSVNSRRLTAINMGTHHSFEIRDDDPLSSWVGVYQDGVHVGYSAKAIRHNGRVENLFCPLDRNTSTSTFVVQGKSFSALLTDNRQLKITDQDGEIVYERRITGDTSLYELRSGGEPFGWLVGWHKYDGSKSYGRADFTVVRVLVPSVDAAGVQSVEDLLIPGLRQSDFADLLPDEEGSFTFVFATGINGILFSACLSGCTAYWYFPLFIQVTRSPTGMNVSALDEPPTSFGNASRITHVEQFIFSWYYGDAAGLEAALGNGLEDRIRADRSCPSFSLGADAEIPTWSMRVSGNRRSAPVSDYERALARIWEAERRSLGLELRLPKVLEQGVARLARIWGGPEEPGFREAYRHYAGTRQSLGRDRDENAYYRSETGDDYWRECSFELDGELVFGVVGLLNLPMNMDVIRMLMEKRVDAIPR